MHTKSKERRRMHQSKKEQTLLSSTNRLLHNHVRESIKMAEAGENYGLGSDAGLTGEHAPWTSQRKIRI
ncbi:hypothetical protein [Paenibacillus gansuensis]|uniref:Uncharacterized protein n=1 Tax=Paenibacillus gansuensis TaxID=306542 RepID=A0ABW5PBC9_9BACL